MFPFSLIQLQSRNWYLQLRAREQYFRSRNNQFSVTCSLLEKVVEDNDASQLVYHLQCHATECEATQWQTVLTARSLNIRLIVSISVS